MSKGFVIHATALLIIVVAAECRRVRLKPSNIAAANENEEEAARQVVYYNPEHTQQTEEEQPVIIGSRQTGGYGRAINPPPAPVARLKAENSVKSPPVQTIRNFNKLNDDGSFTFGYEAADGSFKEETRGIDCVVRGKYGYVDPDGNKREFTYVSGNPCDPNAISQEEEDELKDKSNEEENIPANIPENIPRRPNFGHRPIPPRAKPAATTVFQQSYNNDESIINNSDEQDNQLQLHIKQPLRQVYKNNLILGDEEIQPQPQIFRSSSTARPRITYQPSSLSTTRLIGRPSTVVENQPATTYRPQLIQLPVTASPTTLYPRQSPRPAYIDNPSPTQATYFDDQFKKFQLDNNLIPSQGPITKTISNNPIYSTELIYDPSTGQYNTIVYQQVPKIASRPKIQFVSTTPAPLIAQKQLSISSTTQPSVYQQQLIQQQQANQVQQSQQLYNLQVKQQQQQQQQAQRFPQNNFVKPSPARQQQSYVQRFPPEQKQFQTPDGYPLPAQQPFYYLNPALTDERQNLATGQIEAFLRGHNLSF